VRKIHPGVLRLECFLTGEDQLRLCAVLADTPAMETVRLGAKTANSGRTSAGAAMGHHMIAGGGGGESRIGRW